MTEWESIVAESRPICQLLFLEAAGLRGLRCTCAWGLGAGGCALAVGTAPPSPPKGSAPLLGDNCALITKPKAGDVCLLGPEGS